VRLLKASNRLPGSANSETEGTIMRSRFWMEGIVCVGLVALCVAMRLVDHPPNFNPVAGAGMFAAFFVRRRSLALAVAAPLIAMGLSDLVIGGYDVRLMTVVYGSMVFPVILSVVWRGRLLPARLLCCSLLSSCFFFLATNFAVWYFGASYAPNMSGLLGCYAAALPFFRFTLAGDLFYSVVFFGSYASLAALVRFTEAKPHAAKAEAVA
jgi:hypothetical protein